jgi:hypothetical protein
MKLKIIFTLTLLILISGVTKSQKPTIDFGPKLKKSLGKEISKHLHSDSSGHYILFKTNNNTKLVIEKFGNDFKPFFSKKFPNKKTKVIRQHISFANDKFIWLYSSKNKKAKKNEVFLSIIDLEGNIVQTKKIKSISSRSDEPWYHVTWTLSEDKSKLLISGRTSKLKKSTFDFSGWTVVVDENHDILWEKDFSLDFPSNLVRHKSWKVTNNAKAILATEIHTKGNKKRNDLLRFYSLTEEEDYIQPLELNPDSEKVASHKIIEKENGDLVAIAFCYNSIKENKITNILKVEIDGNDFSLDAEYLPFPNQTFKFGRNKISDQNSEKGVNVGVLFNIKDVFFNVKKEIVIVSEEGGHTVSPVYEGGGKMVNKNFYISDKIGIVTISEKLEVVDVSLLPKAQTFVDFNYYTSHAQLKTKDRTYYLYNDHKKNLDHDLAFKEEYKRLKKSVGMIPMIAYFDENGELKRNQLYSRKKIKESIMPRVSKQIGSNKVLIVCFHLSKLKFESMRLGIVTID